jgi:hypothetical protein
MEMLDSSHNQKRQIVKLTPVVTLDRLELCRYISEEI